MSAASAASARSGVFNIHALLLQTTDGQACEIALDDPRLDEGFHAVERDGDRLWRWTDGEARLPAALWRDLAGEMTLTIACDGGEVRGWNRPRRGGLAEVSRLSIRQAG